MQNCAILYVLYKLTKNATQKLRLYSQGPNFLSSKEIFSKGTGQEGKESIGCPLLYLLYER